MVAPAWTPEGAVGRLENKIALTLLKKKEQAQEFLHHFH
jgi:hypothetical protein